MYPYVYVDYAYLPGMHIRICRYINVAHVLTNFIGYVTVRKSNLLCMSLYVYCTQKGSYCYQEDEKRSETHTEPSYVPVNDIGDLPVIQYCQSHCKKTLRRLTELACLQTLLLL